MIPAEFDYVAPDVARRGAAGAARGRRGRQAARRRALADPADEAAAGGADAARRPAPRAGPARHRSATTATCAIGAMTPPRTRVADARARARVARAAATIADQQVRNRGHDRRLARPRRPGLRHAGGPAGLRGLGRRARAERRARDRGRRPVRGLPDDGAREPTRSSPRSGCPALEGYGLRLPEVQPPPGGLGDGGRLRAGQEGAATASCEDVRIGLTHMGSTPLRATAAEEALRGQPLDAERDRRAPPSRPPRAPSRPADLNAIAGLQAPPGARAVPARARAAAARMTA